MNIKKIKALARFTSKAGYAFVNNPSTKSICIRDGKAVATDTFALLEFTDKSEAAGLYDPKAKNGVFEEQGDSKDFPEYKQLIPVKEKAVASVTININYLLHMGQALKGLGRKGLNDVQIEFHGKDQPLTFRTIDEDREPVVGLIMPIRD